MLGCVEKLKRHYIFVWFEHLSTDMCAMLKTNAWKWFLCWLKWWIRPTLSHRSNSIESLKNVYWVFSKYAIMSTSEFWLNKNKNGTWKQNLWKEQRNMENMHPYWFLINIRKYINLIGSEFFYALSKSRIEF